MRNSVRVVFSILKNEYFHSDVTSGEFIHTVSIPDNSLGNEITKEDVIEGIQSFLNWDESEVTFDVIKFGNTWYTTDNFVHYDFLKYNGINYPLKKIVVTIDEDKSEHTYLISTERLYDALVKNDNFSDEEEKLDSIVYYYVKDKYWDLPLDIICKEHLDTPMTLIRSNDE